MLFILRKISGSEDFQSKDSWISSLHLDEARPDEAERVAQTLLKLIGEGVQIEMLSFNCAISENIFKCLNAMKPETKLSLREHGN